VDVVFLLVRWRVWNCLNPVPGIEERGKRGEGGKVRVLNVRASSTDGSVIFVEGTAGSSVSNGRASKVKESVFGDSLVPVSTGIADSLVSTGRASIGRALIGRASNLAKKCSNSVSSSADRRYVSFSYSLSSFRWYCPSRSKSLAIK
jgi:hypothetical protein